MTEEYIELKGIKQDQRKEKIKQFGRNIVSGIKDTIHKINEIKKNHQENNQQKQKRDLEMLKARHEYLKERHKVVELETKIKSMERKNMPKFESGFGNNVFGLPFENKKKNNGKLF